MRPCDSLEALIAKDEIRDLISSYCHSYDSRDIDEWLDLFDDAAIIDFRRGEGPLPGSKAIKGRSELRNWARRRMVIVAFYTRSSTIIIIKFLFRIHI